MQTCTYLAAPTAWRFVVADPSSPTPETTAAPAVSRRRLFAGAGTAGALAATAVALPLVPVVPPVAATDPAPQAQEGGYRLSAHVQRYYQTAKV